MESGEESGSPDIIYYLDKLKDRIGSNVKVVAICDSGVADYKTLWLTSSLRGICICFLEI